MNKEDYVSYEQAAKLKECGFDWKCDRYYIDKIADSERDEWDDEECQMVTVYDIRRYPKVSFSYVAKWLREVKGYHVAASLNCTGYWFAEVIRIKDLKDLLQDGNMYDTYELALSHGLDVILELLTKKQ